MNTMYRCLLRALGGSLLAAALVAPAASQGIRPFPQNALRGVMVVLDPPQVLMNGNAGQLAPGARIRNQANLSEVSGTFINQKLLVNYTIDAAGQVSDVWILRPEEAAVRPWPATIKEQQTWIYDPINRVWSKP